MPKLGLNMTEGLLVEWLKKEGDPVQRGDVLFIVETDKVTSEAEAQVSGTLARIVVPAGETVPVRTVVALIAIDETEALQGLPAIPPVSVPVVGHSPVNPLPVQPARPSGPVLASPVAKRMAREFGIELASINGSGPGGRIVQEDVEHALQVRQAAPSPRRLLASPIARRLAREHGISLETLQGSGPDGQIIQSDVERAIQARQVTTAPASLDLRSIPIEGVRAVVARRMAQSVQTTAQVTLHTEVDASGMVAQRARWKAQADDQDSSAPSYNAILAALVARALRQHPRLNAMQVGETIQLHEKVNIGLAVDTEAGLMVVVVKDADYKSVQQIDSELKILAERAISKKSQPDDLEGSTFTITNLGMYGIDGFTPIINPPEMAILGVGRISEKLVIQHGRVAQRQMLNLSLTFDHRLVDGAPAARFLQFVCSLIENLQ
jgi:pyruvate dehydrogenase E2 component (dihydrolipoyllysine-residue acetyltransferase)